MSRILAFTLVVAAIAAAAVPTQAALSANGTSLAGVSTAAPVAVLAVELPSR